MKRRASILLPVLLAAGAAVSAQSNTNNQIDCKLAAIDDLRALGRTGTFPDGINGCAFATTACNDGLAQISWQQAMDPDHPFITFLLAREHDGRFEQISDRSYVKHGFFALSSSFCGSCSPTDGTVLGLGCSDTYSVGNNGDNFWLGPADEIDPWLGIWDPVCSHFDTGEPAVAPPNDCNGQRSLSSSQASALGAVGHRIRVKDADFDVPGASFWFQGMYIIETEGDRTRNDNSSSRAFTPSWTGSSWNLVEVGSQQFGSVIERWTGATIKSSTNGTDDGRLYLGGKVTGPVGGFYRYEFAIQNRDNNRGVGALRIPVCPGARVRNIGFGDIDDDAGNDWSGSVVGNEVVWSTGDNPVDWNTIYNFWFESDAAPLTETINLDQFDPGPGAATVAISNHAPTGLFNVYLGAGCALDTPPTLTANSQATLGNAGFGLQSSGNAPMQPSILRFSVTPGSFLFGGCTFHTGPSPASSSNVVTVLSDASGDIAINAPVPNNLALEGVTLNLQTLGRDPGNGTLFGSYELSDGLQVRLGNSVAGCP
jgi:hypothetical protein